MCGWLANEPTVGTGRAPGAGWLAGWLAGRQRRDRERKPLIYALLLPKSAHAVGQSNYTKTSGVKAGPDR